MNIPKTGIDGGLERKYYGREGVQGVEKRRGHGIFGWASPSNHGGKSLRKGAEREFFPLLYSIP